MQGAKFQNIVIIVNIVIIKVILLSIKLIRSYK